MKYAQLFVCALVVLAVVQAKPLAVQQGFDIFALFQSVISAVASVAGTVVAAVMAPVLEVAALVEEKVVAPIQNRITSAGLGLAIDQFCGLLPGLVAPLGFDLPNDAKDICLVAAREELKKGFDPKWTEPARV